MSDKIFAEGFLWKQKRESAPEWVIGSMSVKVDEAIEWLKSNQSNGWVNIEVKTGQSGKPYMELDTWKPEKSKQQAEKEDVPF